MKRITTRWPRRSPPLSRSSLRVRGGVQRRRRTNTRHRTPLPRRATDDDGRGDRRRQPRRRSPSTPTATARSSSASPRPGRATTARYYQALVDAAKEFSNDNGFDDPIVVDNIKPADAATLLGDLARQNVDVIIVGAGEIAEPLPDLIAKYPDIFWYCNCGAGFPEQPA